RASGGRRGLAYGLSKGIPNRKSILSRNNNDFHSERNYRQDPGRCAKLAGRRAKATHRATVGRYQLGVKAWCCRKPKSLRPKTRNRTLALASRALPRIPTALTLCLAS